MLSAPPIARRLYYGKPANPRAPLNRGLVAWWIGLPKVSGANRLIDACSDLHATATTGAWSRWSTWGRFTAPVFDGSNDVFTIGGDTTKLEITGSKSVFAWIKTTSASGYQETVNVAAPAFFVGYTLGFAGNVAGRVAVYHSDSASWRDASSGTTNDGLWHHIGFTYDKPGGAYYLWLDGQQVGTGAMGDCSHMASSRWIGAFPGYRHSTFTLGDARVYNRPLMGEEVRKLYHAGRTGYQRELNWLDTRAWMGGQAAAASGRRQTMTLLGV